MRIRRDAPTVLITLCIVAGLALKCGFIRGADAGTLAGQQSPAARDASERAVRLWATLFPGQSAAAVTAECATDPGDGEWWRVTGYNGAGEETIVQFSSARTGDLFYAGLIRPAAAAARTTPLTDAEMVSAASSWLRLLPPARWQLCTPKPPRHLKFGTVVWRCDARQVTLRLDQRSGLLYAIRVYPLAKPAAATSRAPRRKTTARALRLTAS